MHVRNIGYSYETKQQLNKTGAMLVNQSLSQIVNAGLILHKNVD